MTVLVAEPDPDSLLAISQDLTERGFAVLPATTWSAALTAMATQEVHIAVVHSGLADLSELAAQAPARALPADRTGQDLETPLLFTVEDPGTFDWDSYALLDRADYVLGPVSTGDLGHRVNALALRLQRRTEAGVRADQLRTAVRGVVTAIQSTNEPAAIAVLLVSGVADVFHGRHVCLTTFDDERVATLRVQRLHGQATTSPLPLDEHQSAVQQLAARLWRTGAADLGGHDHYEPTSDYPELLGWEAATSSKVSMAVPLGDGASPFGLLWVTSVEDRREWSLIEVSLLRHLGRIATQALMQGRIITGQQEVLLRLRRLDDAKSNFLRTVNHELRTPLTSLSAYLELLREGAAGEMPGAARDMLDIIDRNTQRLRMLVDDVLTFSRMAADPEVNWRPVNVAQLLANVVQALREVAEARGIGVDVEDTAADLVIEGDPTRLRQVFLNIADNAIKFTPAGGHVAISVRRCLLAGVAAVDVAIADTGNGIADDDKSELFTAFFRGSNAEADAVPGTGLGLAIVRGVVDAHGGTIDVTETAGGGTTLSVQLPVHRQPAS